MGLDPHKHLGRDLTTLQPLFLKLQDLYGCNVCGEGGEYESLTLDCPLFKNAKIVLDEFTVQLHSPDTIAPVGVLHPVEFHLEYKSVDPDLTLTELLHEVTNDFDCTQDNKSDTPPRISQGSWNCTGYIPNQEASIQCEFLSKVNRQRHGSVAISCWRQGQPLEEVQCELGLLLGEIERNLHNEELCWADVLYVHLYLNDMKEFSTVNQKYMQHITEKDSVRGVPSRCCVEIPLSQVGMGHVMIEIVAVTDCSKKVLHVQSISSWAPCCIGPYSQATQHQQLIYMAGQLGLDPPTMNLVQGGAACEMAQALKNCEAVAEVFIPMFLDSVLSFTVYCSSATGVKGMHDVGAVLEKYLSSGKSAVTSSKDHMVPKPLVLYILLPGLPKGALVEVAPLTYKCGSLPNTYSDPAQDTDATSWQLISKQSFTSGSSGVQEFSLCKGLVLKGYLCRAFIFISSPIGVEEESISRIAFNGQVALKQAFQLLANVLAEAALGWADVFVLRVYFVVEKINANDLRKALGVVLEDFMSASVPQPTLIPVLGVGETAELQDLIAVELIASGGMT